ncbi:MAG: GerMN domain-containing protein [Bacillota bacterium]
MKFKKNATYILLLIIIILVIAFVLFLRYNISAPEDTEKEIVLYFSDSGANNLVAEKRKVSTKNLYKNTLEELIKGPRKEGLNRTIPEGVEVLNIKLLDGILRINFNESLQKNHWGGSTGETMTVYSIVNTMTQFVEIDYVEFIIEDKKIETLVGHMDLSRPLSRNNKIINE